MNRAILTMLVVGNGICAASAQNPPSSAVLPPRQAVVPAREAPAPGITGPATQVPPGGAYWMNLGTGEFVGPDAVAVNTPAVTNRVRPPSNLAIPNRSNITPVQLQNINRLEVELNGLGLPDKDPVLQQRALTAILQAAPIGNERPSAEAISRLGGILARVVPSLNLTAAQRRQLAIDLNLALNSGRLSRAESERVMADARALLRPGAVSNAQGVEELMGDLSGLIANLQGKGQKQPGDLSSSTSPALTAPSQAGQGESFQSGQGSGTSSSQPKPDDSKR